MRFNELFLFLIILTVVKTWPAAPAQKNKNGPKYPVKGSKPPHPPPVAVGHKKVITTIRPKRLTSIVPIVFKNGTKTVIKVTAAASTKIKLESSSTLGPIPLPPFSTASKVEEGEEEEETTEAPETTKKPQVLLIRKTTQLRQPTPATPKALQTIPAESGRGGVVEIDRTTLAPDDTSVAPTVPTGSGRVAEIDSTATLAPSDTSVASTVPTGIGGRGVVEIDETTDSPETTKKPQVLPTRRAGKLRDPPILDFHRGPPPSPEAPATSEVTAGSGSGVIEIQGTDSPSITTLASEDTSVAPTVPAGSGRGVAKIDEINSPDDTTKLDQVTTLLITTLGQQLDTTTTLAPVNPKTIAPIERLTVTPQNTTTTLTPVITTTATPTKLVPKETRLFNTHKEAPVLTFHPSKPANEDTQVTQLSQVTVTVDREGFQRAAKLHEPPVLDFHPIPPPTPQPLKVTKKGRQPPILDFHAVTIQPNIAGRTATAVPSTDRKSQRRRKCRSKKCKRRKKRKNRPQQPKPDENGLVKVQRTDDLGRTADVYFYVGR